MGITHWRAREPASIESADTDGPTVDISVLYGESLSRESSASDMLANGESVSLAEIEQQVSACRKCTLAEGRIQTVFGTGNPGADWMIVGEAPGAEEDRRGEPFVGRAGQLLNAMISALGLHKDEVYIANVLKCRPPNNRDPLGDEVAQCLPYLLAQIRCVRPKIILALGRFAAQALLQSSTPIGHLRGHLYHYGEFRTPLVVSYHPAYLLRSPLEKRKAWHDLKFARHSLDGETG